MKEILKKYDIFLINENKKNNLIKKLQENKLINKKIITIEELKRKYYYDYNKKAIYYLIKKYNYQYDVAKMYLSHLIEVEQTEYKLPKIEKIKEIKQELANQNLLITNTYFKDYLKGKKIVVFEKDNLSKIDYKLLNTIEKTSEIYYYQEEYNKNNHEEIIECNTKEEEVYFVATQICNLLKNKENIEKIKVYANEDYESDIHRIFKWFNIPLSIEPTSLYKTEIGQAFLRNINNTKEESLEYLEKNFSLKNTKNLEIYNQIITILNEYTWCDDIKELIPFLKDDFKNTKINNITSENAIEIINNPDNLSEDDIVFIMGFNQEEIPSTYKDEDYFSDQEKELLEIETSNELNKKLESKWIKTIEKIKNLNITMKHNNENGECYISSLNDILNLKLVKNEETYNDSNLYNQLSLARKLDTLIKYNEVEKNLNILYSNYPNINYNTYNNNYQEIDKEEILNYLNNHLNLSYSSMNTYYQCAFRYYISNILKLNTFEETFYTIIGKTFHHVLSNCFTNDINPKEEYYSYLKNINYPFNAREKYFIDKLEEELEFVIETINKQNEQNNLTKIYTEELIEIPKNYQDINVTFKGYVDKLMLNDNLDKVAIIDYKTGTPDLNLNHTIYGLDLQLPIYIYLAKHKFKDARIVGFYLQKIINTEIIKDPKQDYITQKEEKLKLQGYSNSDLSLLKEFDPNYETSKVIKGMRTTSKGLASKKVLNDEKIEKLLNLTNQKIDEAAKEIINANFTINPKRINMDNVGCKYCTFKDICYMTEKNIEELKEYKNLEFLGGEENDTEETN